jgi:hypothetical protein
MSFHTEEITFYVKGVNSSFSVSKMTIISSHSNVTSYKVQFTITILHVLFSSTEKIAGMPDIIGVLDAQIFKMYVAFESTCPLYFVWMTDEAIVGNTVCGMTPI